MAMEARTIPVFLHIFVTSILAVERNVLNDYIHHYEALTYDVRSLHHSHGRVRRSLDSSVRLDFHAHGRNFNLVLRRDTTTFVRHPEEVLPDRSLRALDTSHIYQGQVEGIPSSYVHGSIIEGIFSGRIDLPTETYYVDKSELYFDDPQPFHSVIYAGSDVAHDLPARVKRSDSSNAAGTCGSSREDVRRWMEQVQNSAVEAATPSSQVSSSNHQQQFTMRHDSYFQRYFQQAEPARQRRATNSNQKRMCALFLQSDPLLWDYMTKPVGKGGKGYTAERAREEITSLFASHVDGIKKIYINTVFQYEGHGPFFGFTFAVHRVQINTSADCNKTNVQNPFCKANIDVSNFLNLNSLSNHDYYCLAYVFTYRDFSQGTLGLAWVGSSLKASGGLCEQWKEYNENNRRVHKSLNTGIVTLVNYGSRVPPKVSTLTFAHEIGHNYGSPHDSGPECVPTLINPNFPGGNYIMFASATSGDHPNNHNFSSCSIGNMTLVLNAVLNGLNGKRNCFLDSEEAFCGNRIVEDEEECDCGFQRDCHDHGDTCCYPQVRKEEENGDRDKACRRREHTSCSPSEGPCCSSGCNFVSFDDRSLCLPDMECSNASYCNGTSAKCPMPEPKADGSLCNSDTQVCRSGECAGSVCERINWTACSLAAPVDDKNFNRGQLCYVSCWNAETSQCVSTGNVDDIYKPENKPILSFLTDGGFMPSGIQLPAGAPCDNFKGYCDVFQKCRAVNEDGPLARLKNLLFNQQTFNDIKAWITEYWWAVLLIALGLIVMMALFIKLCAVHTPSSNPKQPPARKLTLPRRHTHRSQDHDQPPPYSSSGQIPLRSMPSGGPPHGKRRARQQQPSSSSGAAAAQQKPQRFADLAGPSGSAGKRGGRGHRPMQQV